MPSFETDVQDQLQAIRQQGLWRELRRVESPQGVKVTLGDRVLINFSSNDYLGLANHPAVKEAALKAVQDYGVGSGASRLVSGSLAPGHVLEETLASFKGTAAALTFSTGYATALGTVPAVVGPDDTIILDKRVHACLVDAARLSRARLRVFRHNDLDDLEKKLRWARQTNRGPDTGARILVITESLFSMDGDAAPLPEIVELKTRYGAWLMVDEAHATGLYGPNRRGLTDEHGIDDRIEIQMGTLGKALGSSGGYICGSRALIDLLINRARSFIFSTAPSPATSAAATAAIGLLQSREGSRRVAALRDRCWTFTSARVQHAGDDRRRPPETGRASASRAPRPAFSSPIQPVVVGEEATAVAVADRLREQGYWVPAIRYPTVARGAARLRITLSAAHSRRQIEGFATVLAQVVTAQRSIANSQ